MWSAATGTVSAAATTASWVSATVELCALAFTVLSFWWNTWRRGKLVCGYPRTFAATNAEGRTRLLLPLSLRNTGPLSIGVRALRAQLAQDGRSTTLHHVLTRTAMRLERAEVDFATNFAVEGRAQRSAHCRVRECWRAFRLPCRSRPRDLGALCEEEEQWTPLRKFELVIDASAGATIMSSYITYNNREMLPS